MNNLLTDISSLKKHILHVNHEKNKPEQIFDGRISDLSKASAVLLLIGQQYNKKKFLEEPCIILNKRSQKVRQAGDLCCPGGGISYKTDSRIAKIITLPYLPLTRWPYWSQCQKEWPEQSGQMALLYATTLRECYEEMRLNPLRVRFLGPLQIQQLNIAQRVIYPMVGWISRQKKYNPNWEVEQIIYIPLKDLLNPACYSQMQIEVASQHKGDSNLLSDTFPCFIYQNQNGNEFLWGATYRIVMQFLKLVFNFIPPKFESMPVMHRKLDENYF